MITTKHIVSILAIFSLVLAVMAAPAPAFADGTQTEETTTETICETNSYGQKSCREVTKKTIKGIDRVDEPVKMADTSLPSSQVISLGLLAMAVVSVGAYHLSHK